ncbi:MAG: hypothetical protein NT077_03245 [Candidatus Taylorbacteria bacterium]|nr:hypothetical protein [Candidatus Taylorbacteria bacterium]
MSTATTVRPVKIHLAMKDGPLPRVIRHVFTTLLDKGTHAFVDKPDEADLIVFTEVRDIEGGYSKNKTYAYLKIGRDTGVALPSNCVILGITNTVVELATLIGKLHKELQSANEVEEAKPTEEVIPLLPNALRILVIDDTPENIASAKHGLAGHRLITVTGYQDAMDTLGREKFDVVLTDLHLPMSSRTMGNKFRLGELVPYGILLMVEAARQGARHVAVVTDLGHHDDPFSAAFDHYSRFPVKIEGAKVVMMHAPMKDLAKDWATALDQLTK